MTELKLDNYDPLQAQLMEERVILVDGNDQVIGSESKKNSMKILQELNPNITLCHLGHLMENINKDMLHRAFSVFLFNSEGKLLLQQRSATKITFPLYWTNTCCSHPLSFPEELEEENQMGARRAARRKLQDELGISPDSFELEELHYLTRLHYKAPSDGTWGEHEIDYIFFLQKDIPLNPNPEEVAESRYVSPEELKAILDEGDKGNLLVTPWFKLIVENFISKWWDALKNGTLKEHEDFTTIHKF